ncbi:hypothetical protein ZTR_10027 [Talaromyces verruculosus]|nr:hypothetical protein ZTR_10027 [Talaromyces verruculosus]
MLLIQLFAFFLSSGCLAHPPIVSRSRDDFTPTLRTISQFPLGAWVENIAVRRNGHLLVTLVSAPEVYEIDPFNASSINRTQPAYTFDGHFNVTGITEVGEDVFVVCVDEKYLWKLNFCEHGTPQASLITMIPEAQLFNGMSTLSHEQGIVVIADSIKGCIWRVDINTGAYEAVLEDETMQPEPVAGLNLGINGLKMLGDIAYYTNTPKKLFCRVRLDPISGFPTSSIEIISRTSEADDLAITSTGIAYLATIYQNEITRVWPDGKSEVIAGSLNSSSIPNPTSGAFGRTVIDKNVLYITSGGGSAASINGTFIGGGNILSLEMW